MPNPKKVSTTSAPNRLDNFLPSKVDQEVHEKFRDVDAMLRAEAKTMEECLKKNDKLVAFCHFFGGRKRSTDEGSRGFLDRRRLRFHNSN